MHAVPSRVFVPAPGHLADGNVLLRHPAEQAAWIWHPDKSATETAVLRFRLRFKIAEDVSLVLHVTGDQRFQLRCNGRDLTFGPDRCDLDHWTVQSIKLPLTAGEHELEALVWFIAEPEGQAIRSNPIVGGVAYPPMAQVTWRGGFLLHAEGAASSLLTTGEASWMVEDLTDAVEMERPRIRHYCDVGPSFTFDLKRWPVRNPKPAAVVVPPLTPNPHGVRRPGWCLFPADLLEQLREPWAGGRIRLFRPNGDDSPVQHEETISPAIAVWQTLITKGVPITLPPYSTNTILWDLENYRCGYPVTKVQDGEGAMIEWSWAESLYEEPNVDQVGEQSAKGHRSEIEGKVFLGLQDRWHIGAEKSTETPSLWWRSGRYIRVRITTGKAQITLNYLGLTTTGYPLDRVGSWKSSDASWDSLMPIFEQSFRIAAHETWIDTPYYEQMSYVGDDLLHALSNFAWFGDARLSRRSIELFDWSRRGTGLVAERYPSQWRQESPTYSLLWPMMVRDYAWWRDDVPFIKSLLPGLRSLLAEYDGLAHEDGLLHQLPGWPFVDWVPHAPWKNGCGPGVLEGDSSVVNLHWVLSLQAAAQVEEAYGDVLLSQRYQLMARRIFDQIVDRYWDDDRGLLLDTHGQVHASEHAQMFALITGLLDEKKTEACLAAIRKGDGLAKATIFGSCYVLDALYRHGEEAEFHRRFDFWRALPAQGFYVTPEAPEPSRSDSHAWGAHPAWHTLASIAGVRPAAPGFAKVKIAPLPGPLEHFEAKVVHPRGTIEVSFRRATDRQSHFKVTLPEGISGQLIFNGQTFDLRSGKNEATVASVS